MLNQYLFAGSVFGVMAIGLLLRLQARRRLRAKQVVGLRLLSLLRVFLAKVQKHRGLNGGFLKGDHSLLTELERLQKEISFDVEKIENLGSWVCKSERWQNIRDHWFRLLVKFSEHRPEDNFNQHLWMIKSTLSLIDDVADVHRLIRLKVDGKIRADFLWNEFLLVIEYLGQARAIGTTVAVAGKCSSVDRIKLAYLNKKIERSAAKLLEGFGEHSLVAEQVELLLAYIDNNILVDVCEVSPTDFFLTATATLECLYAQFDSKLFTLD